MVEGLLHVATLVLALCRSHQYMVELFERSGLQLMHTALQKNFPKGLFKVRMYALKKRA
jgi:protein N-terminal methyltransferase